VAAAGCNSLTIQRYSPREIASGDLAASCKSAEGKVNSFEFLVGKIFAHKMAIRDSDFVLREVGVRFQSFSKSSFNFLKRHHGQANEAWTG
jgi:hypothetical protein